MAQDASIDPSKVDAGESENFDVLTWEDSYAIARALRLSYPQIDIIEVSLDRIYHWTVTLPGFQDDPALANDSILNAIVREWIEEIG